MHMTKTRELIDAFRPLGFSDLEATVYIDLLKHPGSTGYRIGRSINKPHANVYQALVSLEQKGAVLFEDGETRIYSAVPPTELLDNLRQRHERGCRSAERALKTLEVAAPEDDRFFRLTSADQVYARARVMIRDAKETVLLESFPRPMSTLRGDLEDAVARGVTLAGLTLREDDLIPGARLHVYRMAGRIARVWRGHELILITDAAQFLLALFNSDGTVERAVWITSPFVATVLNNALVADVVLHTLPESATIGSLNEQVYGFLPPGCRALIDGQAWAEEGDGETPAGG